jgi:hypothetical protein
VTEDFVTFGFIERPWDRARRDAGIFNYFGARDFDPEMWRGGYPNPAFVRMTEADGAWMARILARFSDELVQAAVSVGQYDAQSARYLERTLIARRDAVLRRYLRELSPIADLELRGEQLCGVDLSRKTGVVGAGAKGVSARLHTGEGWREIDAARIQLGTGGAICVDLRALRPATPRAGQPSYLIVEIWNGDAPTALLAHLYDLGPAGGLRLVGVERD